MNRDIPRLAYYRLFNNDEFLKRNYVVLFLSQQSNTLIYRYFQFLDILE